MLSKKQSRIFIIIGASLIVLIFAVWQILLVNTWTSNNVIADNVTINGYDVGGYDVESARQMLDTYFKDELDSKTIEIKYNDISSSITVGSFAEYDFEGALEEAYQVARSGKAASDYMALLKANIFGVALNCEVSFDEESIYSELNNVADFYFVEAQDAYITSFDPVATQGQKISIASQIRGSVLDYVTTSESIKDAISSNENNALAYVAKTDASITDDILLSIDSAPVKSEYTISAITAENEGAIYQTVGGGRYEILLPSQELDIIKFMGSEDYIYFEMPDGGNGTDYEKALTEYYPTQIYLASIMSELEVTDRRMHDIDAKNIPAGTSCITNLYYGMTIKNPMTYPVIIYVGYDKQGSTCELFCEVYRPSMENKTLVRSIIKQEENKTLVDITRVYVDNIGNTVDSIVVDTVEVTNE